MSAVPTITTSSTGRAHTATVHRAGRVPFTVYAGPSREMADDIAADLRGALADAYHAGRADLEREHAAAAAAILETMTEQMERGEFTARQYLAAERFAVALGWAR